MVKPLKKKLYIQFDEAVKKIENLMASEGYIVLLTKNIDDSINKNLNIDNYPRYTIILGCNPLFAKSALDISKGSGLLFPCSFAVYEDKDGIYAGHISIMKIISALNLASASEMTLVIKEVEESIRKIWEKL